MSIALLWELKIVADSDYSTMHNRMTGGYEEKYSLDVRWSGDWADTLDGCGTYGSLYPVKRLLSHPFRGRVRWGGSSTGRTRFDQKSHVRFLIQRPCAIYRGNNTLGHQFGTSSDYEYRLC